MGTMLNQCCVVMTNIAHSCMQEVGGDAWCVSWSTQTDPLWYSGGQTGGSLFPAHIRAANKGRTNRRSLNIRAGEPELTSTGPQRTHRGALVTIHMRLSSAQTGFLSARHMYEYNQSLQKGTNNNIGYRVKLTQIHTKVHCEKATEQAATLHIDQTPRSRM